MKVLMNSISDQHFSLAISIILHISLKIALLIDYMLVS